MSSSLNLVMLMGALGSDPELRNTQSGLEVCNLSVATNDWNPVENKKHTEWHRVVCFGKLAINCHKYLKKGSQVYVEGKMEKSNYTDKEGNPKESFKILAKEVKFLDKKNESIDPNESNLSKTSQ